MFNRLVNLPKDNSFFLFGARSTGKTSLIRKHFSERPDSLLVDLLNEDLFEKYSLQPQLLKSEIDLMKEKPAWVVLDEVQRIPKLLNIVHQLIESHPSMHFVLLGSSSRRLKQKGVNLLAGRAWIRNLYPLTHIELGSSFNLNEALNWGTLPKILALDNSGRADFLKAYAQTYIKAEIQEEQWVRKLEPFRKFLPIAAQLNGKILNYSRFAREVGVEVPTIQSYYEILEDTLLGFHLPAYHKSIRKQQRAAPKFYFFDLGVKKALQKILTVSLQSGTAEWGYAFEHLVICEMIRLNSYYGKDFEFSYLMTKDNLEVDVVVSRPGQRLLFIQIKSAPRVFVTDFRSFIDIANDAKAEALVLSNDPSARIEDGLKFLPWQEGLREIFGHMASQTLA